MRDECIRRYNPIALLLKRKIDSAQIVFSEDVPPDVATLCSRVSFGVDGKRSDMRVIAHQWMTSPVGMVIPINSPRGLALLGLFEGHRFSLPNYQGEEETVWLEKVHFQPEAMRREQKSAKVALDRTIFHRDSGRQLRRSAETLMELELF